MQKDQQNLSAIELIVHEFNTRLAAVETKVDRIDENTQDVVKAFQSAKGAFTVLDFIGKLAKPVIWILAVGSAISFLWAEWLRR